MNADKLLLQEFFPNAAIDLWCSDKFRKPSYCPWNQYKKCTKQSYTTMSDIGNGEEEGNEAEKLFFDDWDDWIQHDSLLYLFVVPMISPILWSLV